MTKFMKGYASRQYPWGTVVNLPNKRRVLCNNGLNNRVPLNTEVLVAQNGNEKPLVVGRRRQRRPNG